MLSVIYSPYTTHSPNMMANAQTFVCKLLEDRWWSGYKTVWNDEKSARIILSATTTEAPNANISYGKHYRFLDSYLFYFLVFSFLVGYSALEQAGAGFNHSSVAGLIYATCGGTSPSI